MQASSKKIKLGREKAECLANYRTWPECKFLIAYDPVPTFGVEDGSTQTGTGVIVRIKKNPTPSIWTPISVC